jgi:hypothetical protein
MFVTIQQLVKSIHASPTRLVLAVAGGGSRAIAELLEVPGASHTLLEAAVPYTESALTAWLGGKPDGACSPETARAMAMVAYLRALTYGESESLGLAKKQLSHLIREQSHFRPTMPTTAAPWCPTVPEIGTLPHLIGVACTAALSTDRPRRGRHRVHIALQSVSRTVAWSLELEKGRRNRSEEEHLASRLVLSVVAEACGLDDCLDLDLLVNEQVERVEAAAPTEWQDLLLGKIDLVCRGNVQSSAIFPGAFHPLHSGHCRMAEIARETLHMPVVMEISILNVDKPPLDYLEMHRRLGQFTAEQPVCFTRLPTFEEKSRLFPGAWFIVGVDTLQRIAEPAYYGNDPSICEAAIERIASRECRFLVFGRKIGEEFVRLDDLALPSALKVLCREIPPEVFREDVSSTEIRFGRATH